MGVVKEEWDSQSSVNHYNSRRTNERTILLPQTRDDFIWTFLCKFVLTFPSNYYSIPCTKTSPLPVLGQTHNVTIKTSGTPFLPLPSMIFVPVNCDNETVSLIRGLWSGSVTVVLGSSLLSNPYVRVPPSLT